MAKYRVHVYHSVDFENEGARAPFTRPNRGSWYQPYADRPQIRTAKSNMWDEIKLEAESFSDENDLIDTTQPEVYFRDFKCVVYDRSDPNQDNYGNALPIRFPNALVYARVQDLATDRETYIVIAEDTVAHPS